MKNATFLIGLAWLVYGALTFDIPDWDVPVSFIMAFCTYACADWVVGVLRRGDWKRYPLALFLTLFTVDGSYYAYWSIVNPEAIIRWQAWPSLLMFLICGVMWQALPTYREALALFHAMKGRYGTFLRKS